MDGRTLLLGIGAQKAGTTWLARYFENHPSVFMSPIKELHFFDSLYDPQMSQQTLRRCLDQVARFGEAVSGPDVDQRRRGRVNELLLAATDRLAMQLSASRYMRFFEDRVGDEPVVCEVTPNYAVLPPDGFKAMAQVHERVKVIFLMRNPTERVWSHYRFEVKQDERAEPIPFATFFERQRVRDFTDYGATLDKLDATFARDDVFVSFYEDLFRDDTVAALCRFAGIAFVGGAYAERVNISDSGATRMPEDTRRCLAAALGDVYRDVIERFPGAVPRNWLEDAALAV